jgi:hypothetical protein
LLGGALLRAQVRGRLGLGVLGSTLEAFEMLVRLLDLRVQLLLDRPLQLRELSRRWHAMSSFGSSVWLISVPVLHDPLPSGFVRRPLHGSP